MTMASFVSVEGNTGMMAKRLGRLGSWVMCVTRRGRVRWLRWRDVSGDILRLVVSERGPRQPWRGSHSPERGSGLPRCRDACHLKPEAGDADVRRWRWMVSCPGILSVQLRWIAQRAVATTFA